MHKLIRRVNQTGSQRPGADRQMRAETERKRELEIIKLKDRCERKKKLLYGEELSCASLGVEYICDMCFSLSTKIRNEMSLISQLCLLDRSEIKRLLRVSYICLL